MQVFYDFLSHFPFASLSKNKITKDYFCVKLELSFTEKNLCLLNFIILVKMNFSYIDRK